MTTFRKCGADQELHTICGVACCGTEGGEVRNPLGTGSYMESSSCICAFIACNVQMTLQQRMLPLHLQVSWENRHVSH